MKQEVVGTNSRQVHKNLYISKQDLVKGTMLSAFWTRKLSKMGILDQKVLSFSARATFGENRIFSTNFCFLMFSVTEKHFASLKDVHIERFSGARSFIFRHFSVSSQHLVKSSRDRLVFNSAAAMRRSRYVFSRRFRRKYTTLTVASFFRQFNAIGPLFCSFVQHHQLRTSKTYSKHQNLVQNKNIDVHNLENIGSPLWCFSLDFFHTMFF